MASTYSHGGCGFINYNDDLIKSADMSLNAPGRQLSATEVNFQRLQRDVQELREKVIEMERNRTSYVSNTESRAERVMILRSNKDILPSTNFQATLEKLKVGWWPVHGSRKFPDANCSEKGTCQHFVSEMLAWFQTGAVEVVDRRKKEKAIKVQSVPDPEAYKRRQENNRGPDCLFYDGLDKTGNLSVIMEGEVTCGGQGSFSDDYIGQVTNGLQRFLDIQPERVEMIGFVTDGRRFEFIRIRRQFSGFHFDLSPVYLEDTGWQILFGLIIADPKILGYRRINIPGYVVRHFLGKGAFSVVVRGDPVEKNDRNSAVSSAEEGLAEEQYYDSSLLPPGYTQRVVPGVGNCFFHAIAHQLYGQGIVDARGEPYTHELLRGLVVSGVDRNPQLRPLMTDSKHLELSQLNGWVDSGAIVALATELGVSVNIYHNGPPLVINAINNEGHAVAASRTLRVMYSDLHYNSVVQAPSPHNTTATPSKRKSSQRQKPSSKKGRVVRRDSLPVAIKIFKGKHLEKRNHECMILESLEACNNVPHVVSRSSVGNLPALVVSPAGHPVLPEKRGVRTNKTDFAHLVAALRYAHSLDICHRDVKPQNIFKDDDGRVILSDWSSAAFTGKLVPWEGSRFFYTYHEGLHIPRPEDDLVALVMSVFMMFTNDDPRNCPSFRWEKSTRARMDGNRSFRRAFQYAEELNYDGLIQFFSDLLS